ncbi:MAG: DUF6263 family protein [Prevotellaceae bacterium]|nr:DUF6263 family protein [Prevotellaceae bacterium]
MKRFTLKISISALALMLVFPVFSQITLQYNFKQGETFKQNMEVSMNVVHSIMDQEMKASITMNCKTNYEVMDVKDENYTLKITYKEFKMNTAAPDAGNISFDSNTPEDIATQQDLGPMFKAIVDKPLETVITKRGEVVSAKGMEKLAEAMRNSLDENIPEDIKQQLITQTGAQFSEESIKALFMQNSNFFPGKPVNTGDSWNVKTSMNIPNFTMDIDTKITLNDIENGEAVMEVEGNISTPEGYEQEFNGMKVKVIFKGTQKGLVKINRNTGWITSSNMTQSFSGNMEIQGMQIPISATSTILITDK